METKLFEWAKRQGISMCELARMTGYSRSHLYRVREQPKKYLSPVFADRIVGRLGEWARSLFLPEASHQMRDNDSRLIHPQGKEAA